MGEQTAIVKSADMPVDMQNEVIEFCITAMNDYDIEKDVATHIKKQCDLRYGPTWHCIVGRNFGSYVTHEAKHFIYIYVGQVAVLLFKSG